MDFTSPLWFLEYLFLWIMVLVTYCSTMDVTGTFKSQHNCLISLYSSFHIYGFNESNKLCLSCFTSGPHEYCMLETFHARCKDNEVIVIQSATYGRMKIGKCVKEDLGRCT